MTIPMMRELIVAALALVLVAGCAATRLAAESQLPPPLIDRLPVRVGVHYSKEFREFVHRETRSQLDYEITLGPAHVLNLDWLLQAMFADVVQVDDPTRVADITPPLIMVLEPKFEEYSFLTPKDVAGEAFLVTIRYLLTVYDGTGGRVDAYSFTGYGRERARTLASKQPLQIATQRAMRDAGAKLAVELTDQETVRMLLRDPREPLPATPSATVPPPPESPPAATPPPGSPPAGTAPSETPPAEPPPAETPPAETAPAEAPPSDAAPADAPPAETPPPATPPLATPPVSAIGR